VLPILGERRCDRIPRKDIAQLVSGIAVAGYASKANHVLITIRGVLAWGLETGRLDLPGNPARDIRRQRTKSRERGLSPDELRLVWEGLKGLGDYEPVIKLILLTGSRRQEIGSLKWSELSADPPQAVIPGSRTKNKRTHVLPLSPLAFAQLPRPRPGCPYVFGKSHARGGFSGWSSGKKALGERILCMEPWVTHDLRRTVVTLMNDHGLAEPHIIEACVNHIGAAKASVAGVYNKAQYASQKRVALERWAEVLAEIVGTSANPPPPELTPDPVEVARAAEMAEFLARVGRI
jgi:integrase